MIALIFTNVALMLVYMALGFILSKAGKVVISHAKSMSAVLIYILSPAMLINSFLQLEYSKESFIKISRFFVITLVVQILFLGILYLVLNKKYDDSKYRIMSAGAALGNVGFLGMPIIASVFPEEPIVLCYSSINVMSMNLIVFTIGVFMITNDKRFISFKSAMLNPTSLSIFAALPLFLLNVKLPGEIQSAISLLAKMVTPMCMLILGIRLSGSKLKDVFTRPFVYITCFLKLIAFPLFAFILVNLIPGLDVITKTGVVVLAMAPSGVVIESLAELHEKEQEFAANVVLLTTILSVISIPLMCGILVR